MVALFLVISVAGAPVALAHATLESTDPVGGTVLTTAPANIELKFSESVTLVPGAIRLFDGLGKELDLGKIDHSDSSVVRAATPSMSTGAYVVAWRVVSADGHPVHGAFTFRVGAGEQASPTLIARLLSQGEGSPRVGALLAVARFLNFVAVAVVVGGLVLSLGFAPANRRSRRLVMMAALVAVLSGMAALALQAPYDSGGGFGDVFDGGAWREVFDSRSGWTWIVRIVAVAALGLLAWRPPRRAVMAVGVGVGAAALFAAEAWAGHGSTGRWTAVAFGATLVHLAAASVWFGGLVFLLAHLGGSDASHLAARFSRWALVSVIALIASGSIQAWRQLGSLHAITSSTYGRLLIVKLVAVAAMLVAASFSRKVVLSDEPEAGRRLRSPVTVEILFGVAVFAVTSLLVVSQPALLAGDRVLTTTLVQGTTLADVTVTPLKPGTNIMHITITSTSGGLLDLPSSIAVEMELPSRDLGPLSVPTEPAGPGHVIATAQIPFSGHWLVTITATYDRFTERQFQLPLDIR